jgi:hypothetical protein
VVELELLAEEEGRRSIQGTATCLPPAEDKLLPEVLDKPEELPPELVLPPELLELPRLLDPDEPLLLEEPGVAELPEEAPPGLVLLPELLPLELSEITAKSIRPEAGLMMVSLIVPSVSPEEPVRLAPINWLARISCCPMRPVAP